MASTRKVIEPILFPAPPTDKPLSFEEACKVAVATGRPLKMTQRHVVLKETIVLKERQHLSIFSETISSFEDKKNVNLGNENENDNENAKHNDNDNSTKKAEQQQQRSTLTGALHSLFLLNNYSQLTLKNIDLKHAIETDDHKKVGAAITLRYKSSCMVTSGSILSHSGFCIWAVQKTSVQVSDCNLLEATMRSSIVCFGQAKCQLSNCQMYNAGVHAICARGTCNLTLDDCLISDSLARGIYAYAGASVTLHNCRICNTLNRTKAAIEISSHPGIKKESNSNSNNNNSNTASASPKGKHSNGKSHASIRSSNLIMKNCTIVNNAGVGVRLRGSVTHTLQNNIFEDNAEGDMDETDELVDDHPSSIPRRESAGTSFRAGDWLCPTCINPQRVISGVRDVCDICQSARGRVLTTEEILQFNRGVSTTTRNDGTVNGMEKSSTIAKWWFDGDIDDDKGWKQYDEQSCNQLEEAYNLWRNEQNNQLKEGIESSSVTTTTTTTMMISPFVMICNGKYRVNIQTMEQENIESHFLRVVRRTTHEQ